MHYNAYIIIHYSLLGIQGGETALYALYHVTGGAKLELSMLGVNLTIMERIKESLQKRYNVIYNLDISED